MVLLYKKSVYYGMLQSMNIGFHRKFEFHAPGSRYEQMIFLDVVQ